MQQDSDPKHKSKLIPDQRINQLIWLHVNNQRLSGSNVKPIWI